ncbi:MAG: hypothetical protein A3G80_04095 [Betaproteobacteria bacterium RIFCSPLOWO2_12_FULL_62_13b]|nr:MAG: hypothetical protein A3G80_04095 [Betaproteobacteria bacterium RIFCSPLOWO2_12_FULL_62_13b]
MTLLPTLRLASAVIVVIFAASAQAQIESPKSYPSTPIRLIVGFTPGGGTDVIARLLGQKMAEEFGQPVVVENKVGAGGIISMEFVAKSKPDGYTLVMAPSSVITVNPIMYRKLPYSSTGDFVPISTAATFPLFLVINASAPIHSMKELVGYIKANPSKANYGGSSGLFQLVLELFKLTTGTRVEFIPYKGGNSEAMRNVMAGNILMSVSDATPVIPALKTGKVRALATTAAARLASLPDIPTMRESGFSDLEFQGWFGLFAPAGTPLPVVRRLEQEMKRALNLPDVRQRLGALHLTPGGNTSEEFAARIATELARWAAIAKAAKIEPAN